MNIQFTIEELSEAIEALAGRIEVAEEDNDFGCNIPAAKSALAKFKSIKITLESWKHWW
jgi:hypothetical protein